MISPTSYLFIYEISGSLPCDPSEAPASYVGLWNEENYSYLFFTQEEDSFVAGLVRRYQVSLISRHELAYRDWQKGIPLAGLHVGGVWFVPADHPLPPPGSIVLDPSVVFGDGTHPTTLACLRSLGQIVKTEVVGSLLDLGTGSGVLALAGAALGIRNILAVDRNRLAVTTARKNVQRNGWEPVIRVENGEARFFIDKSFDIVAANLPFSVLCDLVPKRAITRHRIWIVSGVNASQARILMELFFEQQFTIERVQEAAAWVTFTARNTCRRS